MNFIFKDQDAPTFDRLWNEYLATYNVDFQYTLAMIKYYLAYSHNLYADKSFVMEHNNHCVGICFLPIESHKNMLSISISNGYIIAPSTHSPHYEQLIFEHIDSICDTLNIAVIKFKLSPFIKTAFNKLRVYGFLDTTSTTGIVDLQETQEALWTNLRKRYKPLINSLIKNNEYSLVYSDHTNFKILHDHYVEFHKIHMKNAGKIPKSNEIYDKQLNLLENNLATIIAVQYKSTIIMTDYFFHDTINTVYASSAYDTNEFFQNSPLNHYLLWHAMLYFKERDFKIFGFGEPCSLNRINGFADYADAKELSISHFKKGMGIEMIYHIQGIKFFKEEPLLQLIDQFKSEVINEFQQH